MWPSEYVELNQIEELLTCKICYDFMKTSVITPCSHNYCSLCIRKYLHYKTECPACFEQTYEKDLRVNKVIDEVIFNYSQVKDKLEKCVNNEKDGGGDNITKGNSVNSSPFTPQRAAQIPTVGSSDSEGKNKSYNASTPGNATACIPKTPIKSIFTPPANAAPKVASIFTPKSKKNQSEVACPVCKVNIPEANVNKHLDDCLKRQRGTEPVPKFVPKRKPLSKLVFRLMKDTAIRKKLKEYGLTSQGDRKTLEARLQKYITLYNAECDKTNPRPISELIRQCEEEENIENKGNRTPSGTKRLQVNRNTAENVIEVERKKYLEAHKSSFDQLIANLKKCETPKKPTVRRSIFGRDSASKLGTPSKRRVLIEPSSNIDESSKMSDCRPLELSNTDSLQSDSNLACPLQMYSSETPVKVVERSSTADISMESTRMTFNEDNSIQARSPILCSARKSPYSFHGKVQRSNLDKSISSTSGDDFSPSAKKISKMTANIKLELCQEQEDENAILVDTSDIDVGDKLYNITNEMNSFRGKVPAPTVARSRATGFVNPFMLQSSPKAGVILPDFPCDSSSSESIEQKYSYEVSKCEESFKVVDDEFADEQLMGRTKFGKENKVVSQDSVDTHSASGKRGHDDMSDNESAQEKRQTKRLTNFFVGNGNEGKSTKTMTDKILRTDKSKKSPKKLRAKKSTFSPKRGYRTRSARTKK